jgi:hypothetical protein
MIAVMRTDDATTLFFSALVVFLWHEQENTFGNYAIKERF